MAQTQRRRGGTVGFIVGFGIAIPATIFALSNLESATIEFLGWQAQVPLWAVIGLSLLAGALLGVVLLLAWQARRKHGKKKVAKQAERDKQAAHDDGPPAVTEHENPDTPALDAAATDAVTTSDPPAVRPDQDGRRRAPRLP